MELEQTAADARAVLFEGLVDQPTLMRVLDRTKRTIDRYEADGLPFVKFGSRRLYDLAAVREWIISKYSDSRSREPRRPGRPAGQRGRKTA